MLIILLGFILPAFRGPNFNLYHFFFLKRIRGNSFWCNCVVNVWKSLNYDLRWRIQKNKNLVIQSYELCHCKQAFLATQRIMCFFKQKYIWLICRMILGWPDSSPHGRFAPCDFDRPIDPFPQGHIASGSECPWVPSPLETVRPKRQIASRDRSPHCTRDLSPQYYAWIHHYWGSILLRKKYKWYLVCINRLRGVRWWHSYSTALDTRQAMWHIKLWVSEL